MAFRTHEYISPSQAYDGILSLAQHIKIRANAFNVEFTGGSVSGQVIACWLEFDAFSRRLAALKATPGIVAYAKSVGAENDPTYDVVAEFTALEPLVAAVHQEIESTFPKDGAGWWADRQANTVSGGMTQRAFSVGSLNTLRTALQAVDAQIVIT